MWSAQISKGSSMDIQRSDHVPSLDALERNADMFISLMFSLCEERIRGISSMPDARASSLAHAVMAVQNAIQTFQALARIR